MIRRNRAYHNQIQILRCNSRLLQGQPGSLFRHIRSGFFPDKPSLPYPRPAGNPLIRGVHSFGKPVVGYDGFRKAASRSYYSARHICSHLPAAAGIRPKGAIFLSDIPSVYLTVSIHFIQKRTQAPQKYPPCFLSFVPCKRCFRRKEDRYPHLPLPHSPALP